MSEDSSAGEVEPRSRELIQADLTLLGEQISDYESDESIGERIERLPDDQTEKVLEFMGQFERRVVVDTMSSNASSYGMLGEDFFAAMKKGAPFISSSSTEIFGVDSLLHALNGGHLKAAAIDQKHQARYISISTHYGFSH